MIVNPASLPVLSRWRALRTVLFLAGLTLCLSGCEIVSRMYTEMKKDVKTHMFPEDIKDESPPLATDTYICDSARQLMIYKNEGVGTIVVEYEGRASFLERVEGTKDELYKNNQTTLRFLDEDKAELAREQVSILTNCERVYVHHAKEFSHNE